MLNYIKNILDFEVKFISWDGFRHLHVYLLPPYCIPVDTKRLNPVDAIEYFEGKKGTKLKDILEYLTRENEESSISMKEVERRVGIIKNEPFLFVTGEALL